MAPLDTQVGRSRHLAWLTPREEADSISFMRSSGEERFSQIGLVLALTVLLGFAVTPWEALASLDQVTQSPSSSDRVQSASDRPPPPVAIRIDAAGVYSAVETREIVDGELAPPSGPWVVAWYLQSARPGESGNVVMSGHVDYWNVGPAVFAGLGTLEEGEVIEVTDAAGTAYDYAVAWVRTYPVDALTPTQLREIVGPTAEPSLTLITCSGDFDRDRGEYLMRLVVRAERITP